MMTLIKTAAMRCLSILGLAAIFFMLGDIYGQHTAREQCASKAAVQIAQATVKQSQVTEQVATRAAEASAALRERGREIVNRVPAYVPKDHAPYLPGAWHVLHDDAAQSELSEATVIADAAPVDAQDAATTVTQNYATCHLDAQRLSDLQDWVSRQQQIGQ